MLRVAPVYRHSGKGQRAAAFRPVRLIGMAAGHLAVAQSQLNLFTVTQDARRGNADVVSDLIHQRFGRNAIHRGPPRDHARRNPTGSSLLKPDDPRE